MGVQADTADADDRDDLARSVRERIAAHSDWILLNTCHRVELYGFGTPPDLDARLKVQIGESAVRHLIRVATGLESAIVGEDEVLHQVREAVGNARAGRTLDGRLMRLFETAIAAGRRARAGRTAASGSLAQRAVAWLGEKSSLVGHTVLVAGAGRMGSSLAHSAKLAGADVIIASRDATRARRLAHVYGGDSTDLAGGARLAPRTAGVAVALAGMWHEIQHPDGALPRIADISAPSAVPSAVRSRLNGGFLSIDDLYVHSQPVPRGYIDEAQRIVAAKTGEYQRWLERAE
ncbi:MAG TPA: NAD(P)-binding domain-containing protein [Gemmatimonadales bacterium]|jgi:glutamyl-tRNA reductase